MAEIIVSETVAYIVEKLCSKACREILFSRDLDGHVRRLEDLKTTIEATLLDADSSESCSNAQRDVLDKLDHALVQLDDFLDEKAARAKQQEIMQGNKIIKEVRLFFSKSNQFVSPFRDAHQLKAIMNKFKCIANDHAQFGAIVKLPSVNQTRVLSTDITWSHIITEVVIGRDGDRDNIARMLFEEDFVASETPSVVSIVGIGGMGKTTLARYVYNDEMVKSCFDVRFWVSVTQEFNVKEVLEKILQSSSGEMSFSYMTDKLYDHFLQVIGGKKYLLVSDNIWEQDGLRQKWLKLRSLLAFGAKGSKVLVTTRFQTVAGIMDSINSYMLGDLTENDSWLLFQRIAFTQWQEPGVEVIGKEIANMCPNVPLVIQSIAGLLASKHTLQEWQAFREDQLANFSSYGRDVMQTLRLSYDQLDVRLKLCVAYCSLFPKCHVYDKDHIVYLWISLGYVKAQYKSQSLEESAGAYILSLINYGFFQVERNCDLFGSDEVQLKMQNTMHDLVLSIAGFKYKVVDSRTYEVDERVQHVSFGGSCTMTQTFWEVPSSLFKIKHLQSFLLVMPKHCKLTMKIQRLILRFTSLRVLDLHKLGIKCVPRSLGELKCLRYLNLSYNPMVKFPNSITQLVNLLSLDLFGCYKLEELPKDMNKLVKLRNLKVGYCNSLRHMPKKFGNLTDLRTLDMFIQGVHNSKNGSKANAVSKLSELNKLNSLMGKLTIRVYGQSIDAVSEAKASNMVSKDKLKALDLEFIDGGLKDNEMVMEGLQPNASLRELMIYGYAGEKLPSWMINQLHFWLPNLVSIWIIKCEACKCLSSFGRLPNLKVLNFLDLNNVEYIEEYSSEGNANRTEIKDNLQAPLFPLLEDLWLRNMPNLKGWSRYSNDAEDSRLIERKQAFPILKHLHVDNMGCIISITREFKCLFTLEQLTVNRCEDLKAIPEWVANLANLKKLTLENCPSELEERCQPLIGEDWPKIQHVPQVHIFCKDGLYGRTSCSGVSNNH